MKIIQPILIYPGGPQSFNVTSSQATQLLVNITGDNLTDTCWVYFELQDSSGNDLYHGNISIGGTDYTSWGGDNNYPYMYVAQLLNLTIIS